MNTAKHMMALYIQLPLYYVTEWGPGAHPQLQSISFQADWGVFWSIAHKLLSFFSNFLQLLAETVMLLLYIYFFLENIWHSEPLFQPLDDSGYSPRRAWSLNLLVSCSRNHITHHESSLSWGVFLIK